MCSFKINKIVGAGRQNYHAQPCGKKINFCGLSSKTLNNAGKAIEKTAKKENWFIRFNKEFDKKSENYTIIVTALGTGIVAPIVLTVNPVSKEDSNTKKYTALRQPISAFLALVTQLAVNTPIPKFLDKKAALGSLGRAYLPDPKAKFNGKDVYNEQQQKDILSQLKSALKDDAFRKDIVDCNYKSDMKKAKNDVIKETSYFDRFFNGKVKAEMKKEIQNRQAKVKKLGMNEIGIDEALKYTKQNLKIFKKLTGIVASVSVLYPTFTVLNWMYPRFVEKFFPNLVKDKPAYPLLHDNNQNDKDKSTSLSENDNKTGKVGA